MRKHGGTPSRRDKHVTLAAISPPGVARGRFVGGQQSGLAGSKPPPLFTREASSCSSEGRRQGEPWGASPRPSAPTYLPYLLLLLLIRLLLTLCRLRLFYVLLCSVSRLRFLWFCALLGTCKNQNPISVSRREINAICMHRIERP